MNQLEQAQFARLLQAAEWLAERDAGMLKAVEEAQRQARYWKAASKHSAKRFHEAADERDRLRAQLEGRRLERSEEVKSV